jgi:tetratricopeptide (TPR) repeat protein
LAPATTGGHSVDQVTSRFLGALEQLERRLLELERTAHVSDELASASPGNGSKAPGESGGTMEFSVRALAEKQYAPAEISPAADPVTVLLGKGQALLNLGRAQEALECFDEAIRLRPDNAEGYVRRGMALEKMERLELALASYDQAISTNGALTLAWLYKGAVFNRLQRFREALECYENALKTEQKQA